MAGGGRHDHCGHGPRACAAHERARCARPVGERGPAFTGVQGPSCLGAPALPPSRRQSQALATRTMKACSLLRHTPRRLCLTAACLRVCACVCGGGGRLGAGVDEDGVGGISVDSTAALPVFPRRPSVAATLDAIDGLMAAGAARTRCYARAATRVACAVPGVVRRA